MIDFLPLEIQDFLNYGLKKIDNNGELPNSYRKNLHEMIEEISRKENERAGYYRRSVLAIKCAKETLHYWDNCDLSDASVQDVLHLAENCLYDEFDINDLEEKYNPLRIKVDNVLYEGDDYFRASYAGFSCIAAIETVLYDFEIEILELNEKESDPTDWEACFYSSLAVSGGAVWDDNVNNEKRRNFWIWYLTKAIPNCWKPRK